MNNQENFRDKFSDFLNRKKNHSRASDIFSQPNNYQDFYLNSPTQFQDKSIIYNSPCQSSINSSQLSFSSSKRYSQKSNCHPTASMKKGRLRKVRDIEQNICSICLQPYRDQVEMSCKHSYCNQCLQQWLKTSSKCPYCRADCPFYYHNGNKIRIEEKQYEHQEMDDGPEQFNYQCYMCEQSHEGDEILVCDGCELYACHERCDPRYRRVRLGRNQSWYCHFCS